MMFSRINILTVKLPDPKPGNSEDSLAKLVRHGTSLRLIPESCLKLARAFVMLRTLLRRARCTSKLSGNSVRLSSLAGYEARNDLVAIPHIELIFADRFVEVLVQ